MKSQIKIIVIVLLSLMSLSLSALPAASQAAIFAPDVPAGSNELKEGVDSIYSELQGTGIVEERNITEVIFKYINFALPYLALLVFVSFVYAGILYVANFGVEDQLNKAKTIMIWSVVGLIVIIVSYTVVNLFTKDLVESINS